MYLYTYLVRNLYEYSWNVSPREREKAKAAGGDWRGWRNSFLKGAVIALQKRFDELRASTEKAAQGSTALVRAGNQVDQYFKEQYPHTRSAGSVRGSSSYSASAYDQGREYGSKIPLRRGVGKSGQKSLKE